MSAAICLRLSCPNSGTSPNSVVVNTGPTPGTLRNRLSFSRHTGLSRSVCAKSFSTAPSCAQPPHVLVDLPLDRPRGPAPALLVPEQHFHELPPPQEPRLQALRHRIRQRPHRRPHHLGAVRYHASGDRIRLPQPTAASGEVASL